MFGDFTGGRRSWLVCSSIQDSDLKSGTCRWSLRLWKLLLSSYPQSHGFASWNFFPVQYLGIILVFFRSCKFQFCVYISLTPQKCCFRFPVFQLHISAHSFSFVVYITCPTWGQSIPSTRLGSLCFSFFRKPDSLVLPVSWHCYMMPLSSLEFLHSFSLFS